MFIYLCHSKKSGQNQKYSDKQATSTVCVFWINKKIDGCNQYQYTTHEMIGDNNTIDPINISFETDMNAKCWYITMGAFIFSDVSDLVVVCNMTHFWGPQCDALD